MLRFGNRLAAYLALAVVIAIGIGWYFSTLDGPACNESDTGRCDVGLAALLVGVVAFGAVMPCVVFFGEMVARDRRRRDTVQN